MVVESHFRETPLLRASRWHEREDEADGQCQLSSQSHACPSEGDATRERSALSIGFVSYEVCLGFGRDELMG
jgi:hypothetical protein